MRASISVSVPSEMAARISRLAEERGLKASHVVREALIRFLDEVENSSEPLAYPAQGSAVRKEPHDAHSRV